MTDKNSDSKPGAGARHAVVDRLVFAALREQTRARRWRVFFMAFFFIYVTVLTIILLSADDDYGAAGKPDGKAHTALVRLSGLIASGEDAGAGNIFKGLKAAFEHADTAGIVIEINSPGGSPVQAAYIFDEIMRLKQKYDSIPVYAVVADVAASGGYYVAAAADKIYVNKSSLVGSIGVRLDSFGVVELMEKLGVESRLLTAGKDKAILDPFQPEQADQRRHLQAMIDQVHGHFIDAVRRGRGERLDDDAELFSGLIWSGETALELGLVDAYGTSHSVARELGAEELIDFTPRTDFFERLADRIGSSAGRRISESLGGGFRLN